MSFFLQFAELNDALASTTKKLEKRAFIADYLRSLSMEDAGRIALWLSGTPFAEIDSRKLNVGGSLLSKAVAQLAAASPEAMSAAYRRYGDFGSAASDLLYGHAPNTATLTLAEVESALSALAEARGLQPKLRLFLDLLGRATPVEAKYLIKLLTGDMRTGVQQSLVEEAIAEAWPHSANNAISTKGSRATASAPAGQAVRRASMLLGSLSDVVALAVQGRLAEARMQLFHPIGFMLASPVQSIDEAIARFTEEIKAEAAGTSEVLPPSQDVILSDPQNFAFPESGSFNPVAAKESAFVSGHGFSHAEKGPDKEGALAPEAAALPILRAAQLEDKFDGIRAQLHLGPAGPGTRVALYSRGRDDLSAAFPELVQAFTSIAERAVLDGEILAWNAAESRALPFAALQQRLGRRRVTPEMRRDIPAVLVVFDILYRGTTLLLDESLAERRRHLEDFCARWSSATAATEPHGQSILFTDRSGQAFPRLILARAGRLASAQQLDQAYADARARGNEGVMIKSLASAYQPGRRGLAWLKLKRELATLDVVVTGVEHGHGRRAAVLSDYTFAIRDTDDLAPDGSPTLKNVGKAYTGLTDQEIAGMTVWFRAHTLEDYGHFRTVEPTIVLEVAFNNIMRSSRHASGFALRFPRIVRIRTDKPVAEIDTLHRVAEIYNAQPDKPIE
ncbi:MAG TPA: ATP-dependent DNA ligase [Acidobacteriaceae bacterium]|jgi:DNA ligase-1|nr:ATP-dependent DNA ligase [Acidobacteriaceae bacterium]